MNIADLGPVADFLVKVGGLVSMTVAGVYFLVAARFASKVDLAASAKTLQDGLTAADAEIEGLKRRLTGMETSVANLPSATAIHDLTVRIEALRGKLDVIETRLEGSLDTFKAELQGMEALSERMQRQVDVMDNFIRKQPA